SRPAVGDRAASGRRDRAGGSPAWPGAGGAGAVGTGPRGPKPADAGGRVFPRGSEGGGGDGGIRPGGGAGGCFPEVSAVMARALPIDTNGQVIKEWAERVRGLRERTVTEIAQVVVGMEHVTHQFLIALLAGGHVLLEGVPGVAKTTLSKTFAKLLGIQYQRVQFTPDLLPSDVTGTFIFDRKTNDFVLRKGPIFCQVLLADEVNRAPAKTQAALLEAMQEVQVTIEGTT